jgi:hypothetical protein
MIQVRAVPLELPVLDRVCDDALVAAIFSDDRPPRGLAGLIDWRTDGTISRMAAQGRVTGEFDECVLFATNNRTACGFILFYGLGAKRELTAERLRRASASVGAKLRKAGVKKFAFSIPVFEELALSWPEALGVWLNEASGSGGWDGITVIGDTDKIRKFSLSMPDHLRKKIVFTGWEDRA